MIRKILLMLGCMLAVGLAFGQEVGLPAPKDKIGLDLIDAIKARTVSRSFVGGQISLADLSTILWAGNGQRSASDVVSGATKAMRTIPYSGDVAYIDLYVIDAQGAYVYQPRANALERVSSRDLRAEITPEFIKGSSAMIVFVYDDAKVPAFLKGNPVMVREMMDGTAGFAAENIGLTASALKIATITMYNIRPDTKAVLGLGKDEYPLFIMQLGYAAE